MVELDRPEDIQQFLLANGLIEEQWDETEIEALRLKREGLAKGFVNYLKNRFTRIESRLTRLEGERCGHQKT